MEDAQEGKCVDASTSTPIKVVKEVPLDDGNRLVIYDDGSIEVVGNNGGSYPSYTVVKQSGVRVVIGNVIQYSIEALLALPATALAGFAGAGPVVKVAVEAGTTVAINSTGVVEDALDVPKFGQIDVFLWGDRTTEPYYLPGRDGKMYVFSCSYNQAVRRVHIFADGSITIEPWSELSSSAPNSECGGY